MTNFDDATPFDASPLDATSRRVEGIPQPAPAAPPARSTTQLAAPLFKPGEDTALSDAEILVASVIADPKLYGDVTYIQPLDFDEPLHQTIWTAIAGTLLSRGSLYQVALIMTCVHSHIGWHSHQGPQEPSCHVNRVQLTTDDHAAYLKAVESAFGIDVDFAQLVKIYGDAPSTKGQARYSPAQIITARPTRIAGAPESSPYLDLYDRAP